jgi:crossover junction endodeoxyribonuclease RusA
VLLKFEVKGTAAPQGSKRGAVRGRTKTGKPKVVMIESAAGLAAWRADVAAAAEVAAGPYWEPLDGPLLCRLLVFLPKPKTTKFGDYPAGPPDVDKLQRAIGDALTKSKVITDDARIVQWVAGKRWAPGPQPFAAVALDHYPPRGES